MRQVETAFVLAGGGSLGAVQVGMPKALVERDVVPDLVVGASVGAINAAYLAGAPDPDGVAHLGRIWRRLRRRDIFPVAPDVESSRRTRAPRKRNSESDPPMGTSNRGERGGRPVNPLSPPMPACPSFPPRMLALRARRLPLSPLRPRPASRASRIQ